MLVKKLILFGLLRMAFLLDYKIVNNDISELRVNILAQNHNIYIK